MNDDAYCLFIIFVCLLNLAMPVSVQVIFAAFSFALVLLTRFASDTDDLSHRTERDRYGLAGR
jgi:hypothetical protein